MKHSTFAFAAVAAIATVAAAGVVIAAQDSRAPEPAKPVDPARLFTGRWYEIARTPMKITDGCVAGATDYDKDDRGRLIERDSCRDKTPEGKEKIIAGPVTILDPASNTKFKVSYKVLKIITTPRTYWILDRSDNYDWFIMSDPSFKYLSLFTRAANPDAATVGALTARTHSLGYDTSRLEFPTRFPQGEGQPAAR
jgi:apolipoprotein D and lipocalin family protein